MTPHNSFLSYINSRGDPFPHGAVVDRSWDRWTEWRLLGDQIGCGSSEADCGNEGFSYVSTVDKVYHGMIDCAIVSGILGIVWSGSRRAAVMCAKGAAFLSGLDNFYRRVSVGRDHGDGIVPESSQRYPFIDPSFIFVNPNSVSHLGETHSTSGTGKQIANAIQRLSGVSFAQ